MRKSHRNSGWRQTRPDPSTVGPLLRKAGFIGPEANPLSVRASFDDEGNPRRVHATYADGWSCTMHLARDGSYSLTQSLRIRVSGKIEAS